MRVRRVGRASMPALVALLLASGLLAAPPLASPAAAADELREVATATYVADPGARVVHVAVTQTVTNLKPNVTRGGVIRRFFYDDVLLAIHSEATRLAATDSRGALRIARTKEDGYDLVTVRLRTSIFYRESAKITLRYDLPGGAPRSESEIRVGQAFVGVYLYAWGDAGQGSVRVELPTGFEPDVIGDALTRSDAGDTVVLTANAIKDPFEWFAVVSANREAKLSMTRIALGSGDTITIRGWPEDEEWQTRVAAVLRDGAPLLRALLGLDWPVHGDLTVTEVQSAALEGYAGIYDTFNDSIQITEDLDELTIVHEASHAWFNDDLFDGRWITEGLADTYASLVLDDLNLPTYDPPTAPVADGLGAVRLNDWVFPGRIDDDETAAREDYGYNASWYVVRSLVDEVGEGKMRDVLRAAQRDEIAYVGDGAPEKDFRRDWHRFLDLLEERAGSATAEKLFSTFVVGDEQAGELETRATARAAYAKLVSQGAAAGGWRPPFVVRDAMAKWRFDEAGSWMTEATGILEDEADLERQADALEVNLPDDVAEAWRDSTQDFTAAHAALMTLSAAIDDLASARTALVAQRDFIATVGLLGARPDDRWTAAAAAFEAGDLVTADTETDELEAMLAQAAADGRTRLGGGGALLGGIVIGGLLIGRRRRQRRTAWDAVMTAPVASAPAAAAAEATLPADSVSADPEALPTREDEGSPEAPPVPPAQPAPEA